MPKFSLEQEDMLLLGFVKDVKELKPYLINKELISGKSSEINFVKKSNHIEINNFKKPKTSRHVRRYKMFKDVINSFNQRLGIFKTIEFSRDIEEINEFLKNEESKNNTINFWNIEIADRINLLGKAKKKFIDNINKANIGVEEAKTKIKNAGIFEKIKLISALAQAGQAVKNSEKLLKQFEDMRKSAKFQAFHGSNVATLKTLRHTIINKNKGSDHSESTGMVGTLFKVDNFIKDKISNNQWKHTPNSEFKDILDDMKTKSKGFDKSMEKFGVIKREYEKMMDRSEKQISEPREAEKFDAGELKTVIKGLENELSAYVNDCIEKFTEGIKNKKIKNIKDVKNWNKISTEKFNDIYEKFIEDNEYKGKEDLENRVNSYMNIYCCTVGMLDRMHINDMEKMIKACNKNDFKIIIFLEKLCLIFSMGALFYMPIFPFISIICGDIALCLVASATGALVGHLIKVKIIEKAQLCELEDHVKKGKEIRDELFSQT